MIKDIETLVLNEDDINEINTRLAKQLSSDLKGKNPLFIGLLKGCQPFMSDLLKKVTIPLEIDYMDVSSYKDTESTGVVNIIADVKTDLSGRVVVLVDDIIDTGRTTLFIKNLLLQRGAKELYTVALLNKKENRKVDIDIDYYGDIAPNHFLVGYGLDYNEKYRNLAYIGILKKEIYN